MNKDILDLLACPVCSSGLRLEGANNIEDQQVSGLLVCIECNERYPIENGIPNLLPPELR